MRRLLLAACLLAAVSRVASDGSTGAAADTGTLFDQTVAITGVTLGPFAMLGIAFDVGAQSGVIDQLWFYRLADVPMYAVTVMLATASSGAVIASGLSDAVTIGWVRVDLASPVPVAAGVRYYVYYSHGAPGNIPYADAGQEPIPSTTSGLTYVGGVDSIYGPLGEPHSTSFLTDVHFIPAAEAACMRTNHTVFIAPSSSPVLQMADLGQSGEAGWGVRYRNYNTVPVVMRGVRLIGHAVGSRTVHMWSTNNTVLAVRTFSMVNNAQWTTVYWPSPVQVAPGDDFAVVISTPVSLIPAIDMGSVQRATVWNETHGVGVIDAVIAYGYSAAQPIDATYESSGDGSYPYLYVPLDVVFSVCAPESPANATGGGVLYPQQAGYVIATSRFVKPIGNGIAVRMRTTLEPVLIDRIYAYSFPGYPPMSVRLHATLLSPASLASVTVPMTAGWSYATVQPPVYIAADTDFIVEMLLPSNTQISMPVVFNGSSPAPVGYATRAPTGPGDVAFLREFLVTPPVGDEHLPSTQIPDAWLLDVRAVATEPVAYVSSTGSAASSTGVSSTGVSSTGPPPATITVGTFFPSLALPVVVRSYATPDVFQAGVVIAHLLRVGAQHGWIDRVWFYRMPGTIKVATHVVLRTYENNGARTILLSSATSSDVTGDGWIRVDLPEPVRVYANARYAVGYWRDAADRVPYILLHYDPVPYAGGGIVVEGAVNGYTTYETYDMPYNANHMIDVRFSPTDSPIVDWQPPPPTNVSSNATHVDEGTIVVPPDVQVTDQDALVHALIDELRRLTGSSSNMTVTSITVVDGVGTVVNFTMVPEDAAVLGTFLDLLATGNVTLSVDLFPLLSGTTIVLYVAPVPPPILVPFVPRNATESDDACRGGALCESITSAPRTHEFFPARCVAGVCSCGVDALHSNLCVLNSIDAYVRPDDFVCTPGPPDSCRHRNSTASALVYAETTHLPIYGAGVNDTVVVVDTIRVPRPLPDECTRRGGTNLFPRRRWCQSSVVSYPLARNAFFGRLHNATYALGVDTLTDAEVLADPYDGRLMRVVDGYVYDAATFTKRWARIEYASLVAERTVRLTRLTYLDEEEGRADRYYHNGVSCARVRACKKRLGRRGY